MAVIGSTGQKVTWSEISSLYTKLNQARTKFSFAAVTVPSSQVGALITTSQLSSIDSTIKQMRSANNNVGGLTFSAITIPAAGTLIKPLPYSTTETNIDFMINNCANNFGFSFNSSFFTGNFGFSFNTSFNASFSFNSSFFSSNFGFSFTFNSSFNTTNNNFSFSFFADNFQFSFFSASFFAFSFTNFYSFGFATNSGFTFFSQFSFSFS